MARGYTLARLIATPLMSEYQSSSASWIRYTKPIKAKPWADGIDRTHRASPEFSRVHGPSTEQNRIALHRILADLKFEKGRADDDRSIPAPSLSLPSLLLHGIFRPYRDSFRALHSPIMERYISGRLLPQTDPFI